MRRIAILGDDRDFLPELKRYLVRFERETGCRLSISLFSEEEQLYLDCLYCSDYHVLLADLGTRKESKLDSLARIREMDSHTAILLISARAEDALSGYRIHASGFLLKPMSYRAFSENFSCHVLPEGNSRKGSFLVPVKDGVEKLDASRLLYVFESGLETVFHTLDGEIHSSGSLGEVRSRLHNSSFFPCGSRYLVNLEHVDSIEGEIIRVGEISVPISQGEKESALNALDRYLSDAGV
jgi:DNA-binding LytR/AlgR family response regulator